MITVLMPVRNNSKYLKKSINSILNQTYTDFEFIIIDDNSSEAIDKIIESYSDNRIKFYRNNKWEGIPYCLNRGMILSKGNYFCRQDSDDVSMPDRFEKMINKGAFVVSKCKRIDNKGNFISDEWMDNANNATPEYIKKNIHKEDYIVGGCPMWSRAVFDKIGFFDPEMRIAQCYNYWIRILKYFDIVKINEPLYFHRRHKGSHRTETNKYFKQDFFNLAKERAIKCPIIKNILTV